MEPNREHVQELTSTRYAVLGVAAGLSVLAAGAAAGGVMARVSAEDAPATTSMTPTATQTDPSSVTVDTGVSDDDDLNEGSVYTDTEVVPSPPSFSGTLDPPATSSRQS